MKIAFDEIRPGDRVTIAYPLRGSDKVAQHGTGTAVMRNSDGWALNMGGPHGTPGLVDSRNFVSVTRSKSKVNA